MHTLVPHVLIIDRLHTHSEGGRYYAHAMQTPLASVNQDSSSLPAATLEVIVYIRNKNESARDRKKVCSVLEKYKVQ